MDTFTAGTESEGGFVNGTCLICKELENLLEGSLLHTVFFDTQVLLLSLDLAE